MKSNEILHLPDALLVSFLVLLARGMSYKEIHWIWTFRSQNKHQTVSLSKVNTKQPLSRVNSVKYSFKVACTVFVLGPLILSCIWMRKKPLTITLNCSPFYTLTNEPLVQSGFIKFDIYSSISLVVRETVGLISEAWVFS